MHGISSGGTKRGPSDFDRDTGATVHGSSDDQDILVVDDTPGNVLAIEAALLSLGKRLVTARSGPEALARLLEADFTLILLDVQMPVMDGFETARLIRSRARNRHVPIIFMTAYGRDEAQVLEAYSLGAIDFLFKPIHPQVLRAKAGFFVEFQARTRELARAELEQERQKWEADALRQKSEGLAHLNAELAEADRRKDEFLAMLAHELRNPLAPIELSLDAIRKRSAQGGDLERPLEIAQRQVGQLTRLVDDLLDVSRFTAGKIELRLERIALSDAIEQALVTSGPWISDREQDLVVEVSREPLFVSADLVRLTQVLSNLLNNAARYTPQGGRITLTAGREGEHVFVRVVDTGRGISEDLLARIFDMFVQERRESASGGLGLGLTLAKRLMQLHGGTICARSDGPDCGSEFEIRLPIVAAPGRTAGFPQPLGPPQPVARPCPPLRVVVVDDSPDIVEAMTDLLQSGGHAVSAAADGGSALELIARERPDIAFVDVDLPVMSGYEVARKARAILNGERVRLVAMTGYGGESNRKRALAAGFDQHLCKPASVDALERALLDAAEPA
jgi:two-component system, sensor histidine kinase